MLIFISLSNIKNLAFGHLLPGWWLLGNKLMAGARSLLITVTVRKPEQTDSHVTSLAFLRFRNVVFEITATDVGVFEVSGRFLGRQIEKVELVFQVKV